MVNFATPTPDWDSQGPAVLYLFLSSGTSICSTMPFPPLEILIMLLSEFPLTFHQTQNRMSCFIVYLMTILVVIRMVFMIISEMFHGKIPLRYLLKIPSAVANEFCEWFQVGIDVYIPYCKYEVKPHSPP